MAESVEISEKVVKENAVLEKAESAVEKKVEKVERKTDQKNIEVIAKMIMEKLNGLNIELSEISELNEIAKEVVKLNVEIQKLSERRLQLINRGKEIIAKINSDSIRLLEFLGIINIEEIERAIGKTQIATVERVERASRGNGLSDKKIVYNGKMYNMATYFMKKMGISGGLRGLEEWAKTRGLSLKIDDDVIYII